MNASRHRTAAWYVNDSSHKTEDPIQRRRGEDGKLRHARTNMLGSARNIEFRYCPPTPANPRQVDQLLSYATKEDMVGPIASKLAKGLKKKIC